LSRPTQTKFLHKRHYVTVVTATITTISAFNFIPGIKCKDIGEQWDAGMVICLERGADLHMAQLMPLPLTLSCFNKIHIGFTFLVPAHLGIPGKTSVKRVCESDAKTKR